MNPASNVPEPSEKPGQTKDEVRYRTLVEATTDIIWTNNAEGKMEGEQPGWARFTGQTFDEYQGYGWSAAVHPDDAQPTVNAWNEAVRQRAQFMFEHRVRRHDGEWRHCAIRATPVFDPDGTVHEWIGVHTDITERKIAEAALRESETRFRRVFDNTVLPILIWDGELVTDANQAAVQLLGHPLADYHAGRMNWRQFTPAGYEVVDNEMVDCLLLHGLTPPFQKEYIHADGRYIPVEIVSATFTPGLLRGVAFVSDLTARRKSEADLMVKERHLRLAIESTGLGTWEAPPDYQAMTWSERTREILDYPRDAAPSGIWLARRLGSESLSQLRAATTRAIDPAAGSFEIELPFKLPDRKRRWLRVTGRGVFKSTPAGRSVCESVIGTVLDITSVKRSDEQLRDALGAAQRASAAKDDFLAKLSHELRTPLTPVLMAVSAILEDGVENAEHRADLEMIHRNIELESRLIDDLLDVTRIAHGKLTLEIRPCDLHAVIGHALQVCANGLQARRIEVTTRLDAPQHVVLGDPTRLQQVFWNLITNAGKFTPERGRIEVVSENIGTERIRVLVRDSGVGIEPDRVATLFDAFDQGDNTVTKRYGGLGLGLAICKGVIHLHGGLIRAESAGRGTGASLIVELETATVPPLAPAAPSTPASGPHPSLRVLLVEDHQNTADVLQRLIRRAGHEVRSAASVSAAKQLAAEHPFDLLISDLGLPDGTGLELMAHLRATQGLAGIALSGYGTQTDLASSRAAGFLQHLIKPVDWKHLEISIRQVERRTDR